MNRILKKIADGYEELDDEKRVAKAMKDLGFEWCTTGGNCDAYCKKLGESKTMYVVDDSGISVPETLDGTYMVVILENEGTDEESESVAEFNGFEDFATGYNDMSNYQAHEY